MCENCCEETRITSIKIDENREVYIEDLLMKLATVQDLLKLQFMEGEPLNGWTRSGMLQSLADVSHALKCACWGHKAAFQH